jgi:pimeloyl-ACP methyl ester carboxylesterase
VTGVALGDPFAVRYDVPVGGGTLRTARSGPPVNEADAVVLAIHGITSSLEIWRSVARELSDRTRLALIAPDLRGRGHSWTLPGPYGITAHLADLISVLDEAGARRAVVVGHSLGAFVAAGLAVEHAERVAGLVLVDGGLPVPPLPGSDLDEVLEEMFDAAVVRSDTTFDSLAEYAGSWQAHPAFAQRWDDDVDAYSRYEAAGDPGDVRLAMSPAAVRADLTDLTYNPRTSTAIERASVPTRVLRAARGMHDEPFPLLPRPILDAFLAARPDAVVEEVADVNHYTIALGAGPGPRAVAAAIEATADQATSTSR